MFWLSGEQIGPKANRQEASVATTTLGTAGNIWSGGAGSRELTGDGGLSQVMGWCSQE